MTSGSRKRKAMSEEERASLGDWGLLPLGVSNAVYRAVSESLKGFSPGDLDEVFGVLRGQPHAWQERGHAGRYRRIGAGRPFSTPLFPRCGAAEEPRDALGKIESAVATALREGLHHLPSDSVLRRAHVRCILLQMRDTMFLHVDGYKGIRMGGTLQGARTLFMMRNGREAVLRVSGRRVYYADSQSRGALYHAVKGRPTPGLAGRLAEAVQIVRHGSEPSSEGGETMGFVIDIFPPQGESPGVEDLASHIEFWLDWDEAAVTHLKTWHPAGKGQAKRKRRRYTGKKELAAAAASIQFVSFMEDLDEQELVDYLKEFDEKFVETKIMVGMEEVLQLLDAKVYVVDEEDEE